MDVNIRRSDAMRGIVTKISLAALLAASLGAGPVLAGGFLESLDITGNVPSPIPGQINAKLVRIFHDSRCIPVQFQLNRNQDPIPNPLGGPVVSLAAARTTLQKSFDSWNKIPTSYIEEKVGGTINDPGFGGFDMIDELTFNVPPGFGFIAVTPSITLIADTQLHDGDDIDGDGVSDVSSAITTCKVGPGGHTIFPAGFYKAGTILDVDVQFNTTQFRFTVNDADVDTNPLSVDLQATATHEFGHSFGLSHVLNNQKSPTDGTSATMFPFIDTNDPASELAQRTLDSDDVAYASFYYPEGSAASGPAALQPGDIPFNLVYGTIKGSVTHGVFNQPVAGASVSAINLLNGEEVASAFSGTAQVSFDPATGEIFLVSEAYNILNGNYTMPVPLGLYTVGIEAVDGSPVPSGSVSLTAQLGDIFGLLDFNEEFWSGPSPLLESAIEIQPGFGLPVAGIPGFAQSHIDFVTNDQVNISNFGSRDFIGFTGAAPGTWYAVGVRHLRLRRIRRPRLRRGGSRHRHGQRHHGDARPRPPAGQGDQLRRPGQRLRAVLLPVPRSAGAAGEAEDRQRPDQEPVHGPAGAHDDSLPGGLGAAAVDRARWRQRHQRRADQRSVLPLDRRRDVQPGQQLQLPLLADRHQGAVTPLP